MTLDPAGAPIRVSVVVPTYKQPGLLAEALHDALAQRMEVGHAVVVVDDGCPYAQTREVISAFSASRPGRVLCIPQRNRGLSAARNAGIDLSLAAFPDLDAVYFLDSDNRLLPGALQRLHAALRSAPADVGWCYTDIVKFCRHEVADTYGDYAGLEHLMRNVSEAGSMVHRRVLGAGIRFDEAMREGYEDWEFWLQGLEAGFRGLHVRATGFRYRLRPESMLAGSVRRDAVIREYIRRKHPALFAGDAAMRREWVEAPRHAVLLHDSRSVLPFPAASPARWTVDAFLDRYCQAQVDPTFARCPGTVLLTSEAAWAAARDRRIAPGLLWQLETALEDAEVALARFGAGPGRSVPGREVVEPRDGDEWAERLGGAQFVMVRAEALERLRRELRDAGGDTTARLPCVADYRYAEMLGIGQPSGVGAAALDDLLETARRRATETNVAALRGMLPGLHRAGLDASSGVACALYGVPAAFVLDAAAAGPPAPLAACCVAPSALRSAATVLGTLARLLRAEGYVPHLFVLGAAPGEVEVPPGFDACHTLLSPLVSPAAGSRSRSRAEAEARDEQLLVGTFCRFALVLSGVEALHPAAGPLRRLGCRVVGLLLREAAEGALRDVVAHEAAYDAILAVNGEDMTLLAGRGVPREKCLLMPDLAAVDGPGVDWSAAARALAGRAPA